MEEKQKVHISKFLSKHLRHDPAAIGLSLAPGGWVLVDDLLAACAQHNLRISRAELDEVVSTNPKQRFAFDPTGTQIRANQGHSVEVDLQLPPAVPPAVLYHGTGHQTAEAIATNGLQKMNRQHVHLSLDTATARTVGARHGRPVIFAVDAAAMQAAGFTFWVSDNGVWLVDHVPPEYLRQL